MLNFMRVPSLRGRAGEERRGAQGGGGGLLENGDEVLLNGPAHFDNATVRPLRDQKDEGGEGFRAYDNGAHFNPRGSENLEYGLRGLRPELHDFLLVSDHGNGSSKCGRRYDHFGEIDIAPSHAVDVSFPKK
jgi:hypothetical protein